MAAEEGNISRAAARLNISQPAVSRQIKDLEEELGVELFVRASNGLRLTQAGSHALGEARNLLRQANHFRSSLQSFTQSAKIMTLNIGYLPTSLPVFLTKGLKKYNALHPEVCVRMEEMTPARQESALARGEIDLAFIGSALATSDAKYQMETVFEVPVALALPDDHPMAGDASIDLSNLGGEGFLSLNEKIFPGRPAMEQDLFDRAGISPTVTLRARGLSELLGHVGTGAGVALIPSDLSHLPHAGVSIVPLSKPTAVLHHMAVWIKDQETPALLDLVKGLKAV